MIGRSREMGGEGDVQDVHEVWVDEVGGVDCEG